jgi:branched-chain amino acid transport system substrate-binding protein
MFRSRTLAALSTVVVLTLAACGGDDDDGAGGSTDGSVEPAAAGTDTTTGAADGESDTTEGSVTAETTGSETTGGGDARTSETDTAEGPADDSLEPVVVGFHNLEGGVISLPQIREGFEQGVRYVNERQGGINGHPLEFEACNVDVTPESSVNCANQFVERGVVAAIQGVDVAADAALPILQQADTAEIAFFPFSPAVNKAPGDAFITLFSTEEVYAASLITMQELGAQSVAELIVDLPSGKAAYEEAVAPTAETLGLDVEPFYYVQASVDWTSFAATVMATNPDAVDMVAPTDADCTAAVQAFRGAGYEGIIHAGSCVEFRSSLDQDMVEGIINHNNFYESGMDDIPAKVQGDLDIYREFMEEGAPDAVDTVYGPLGFSIAVDAAAMLRQVPEADMNPAGVKAALAGATGVKFFTESPFDCSSPTWPGTSACGSEVLFSRNLGEGDLEILEFAPVDISPVVPD